MMVAAAGFFRIEAEALLAPVLLHVVGAAAIAEIGHAAGDVAAGGEFDLDDLGAHLAEVTGGGGSRQHLGEIQYAVALEHALGCLRHGGLRLPVREATHRITGM